TGEDAAELSRIDSSGPTKLLAGPELAVDQIGQEVTVIRRRHAALVDSQPSFEVLTDPVHRGPGFQAGPGKLRVPPGGKARPLQSGVVFLLHPGEEFLLRLAEFGERNVPAGDGLVNKGSLLCHIPYLCFFREPITVRGNRPRRWE